MNAPRCNMPKEEAERLLGKFSYPYLEEMTAARRGFRTSLFFETWGRRDLREVFCPECGRFDIERQNAYNTLMDNFFDYHHGDQTICPQCGTPGILISLGRMKTFSSLSETRKVLILREEGEALLAMAGKMHMEYRWNDLDPLPHFEETARYAFEGERRVKWTQEYEGGWKERVYVTEPFADGYNMGGGWLDGSYDVIGAGRIRKTGLRYCQIDSYFISAGADLYERGTVRGVIRYLAEYTRRPQMEMLVKLDHTDVIQDLLSDNPHGGSLNWKAKTPQDFFRMSRSEYAAFRKGGGKITDYEAWRRTMPDSGFGEWLRLYGIFGAHLGQFLSMFGKDPRRDKIVRWYSQQQSHCSEIWAVWQDLLNLERELGNDVTHDDVLMPEDLGARHDAAAELRNRLEKKTAQQRYAKLFKKLKKRYAYSDGTLSVVVPTCAEEIENEGAALRHCVAGYAERHIKGIKTILFLRWADDIRTPYVTVEVEPWGTGAKIIQIHGYRNEGVKGAASPKEIHEEFLDEWLEWIRQGSPRTNTGKPVRPRMNSEEAIAV